MWFSTGTTLRNAGLRIFAEPLMHSEAVLIRSPRLEADDERLTILSRRLQGVLTAQRNVLMDYDIPVEKVSAAVDITPGFESPTISPLHDKQWAAVFPLKDCGERWKQSAVDRPGEGRDGRLCGRTDRREFAGDLRNKAEARPAELFQRGSSPAGLFEFRFP